MISWNYPLNAERLVTVEIGGREGETLSAMYIKMFMRSLISLIETNDRICMRIFFLSRLGRIIDVFITFTATFDNIEVKIGCASVS